MFFCVLLRNVGTRMYKRILLRVVCSTFIDFAFLFLLRRPFLWNIKLPALSFASFCYATFKREIFFAHAVCWTCHWWAERKSFVSLSKLIFNEYEMMWRRCGGKLDAFHYLLHLIFQPNPITFLLRSYLSSVVLKHKALGDDLPSFVLCKERSSIL